MESHNGETWLDETRREGEAGDRPKRPAARWRRGHLLTVASARRRTRSATAALQNCPLGPSAKSRILDRLMASPEQAIRSHRAGNIRFAGRQSQMIQPRPHPRLRASPTRSPAGTHVGRVVQPQPAERQTPWARHDMTCRGRTGSPPRHRRMGPIGVINAHVSPRRIRRSVRVI